MPRQSEHMAIHFEWWMLLSATISGVVSFSVTGLSWRAGASFSESLDRGAGCFLWMFPILTVVCLLGGVAAWIWITRMQSPRPQPRPRKSRIRTVAVHGYGKKKAPKTRREKRRGLLGRVGHAIRGVGRWVEPAPRHPQGQRVFAQDARPVQAKVAEPEQPTGAAEVEQFFDDLFAVTHAMYPIAKITRDKFEMWKDMPGVDNWQQMYADYKSHWTNLGWVDVNGKGTMTWRYDEADLYRSDRNALRAAIRAGFGFPVSETEE